MSPGVTPASSHSLIRRHQATSSGTSTWRPSSSAKPKLAMPPFLRPSTWARCLAPRLARSPMRRRSILAKAANMANRASPSAVSSKRAPVLAT